ncbi:hypothetical protein D0962_34890 [Leptolyngbyaceae cyanobacterium CCMR0082]|uniref:Uncharacterized protein n=1 Tax=Adonisia turfae CCMR0082 TaxID=2304604 RepID=A0A6M0SK59_9CYAN|nr:hypothetical protein [Adonisia turfae]NEZ67882.1 hypothetical protein [Adonisia turfae CCMR0082]
MQIIKEIRLPKFKNGHTTSCMCVVRSNFYGGGLDYIQNLVGAARETYPALQDNQIRVVQFAGTAYARIYGIEFKCPDQEVSEPPEGWREISELEFTF